MLDIKQVIDRIKKLGYKLIENECNYIFKNNNIYVTLEFMVVAHRNIYFVKQYFDEICDNNICLYYMLSSNEDLDNFIWKLENITIINNK